MDEKENQEIIISFSPDYKGKIGDAFLIKMKRFFLWMGIGMALALGGGITFLIASQSAHSGGSDVGWMLIFFFLGVLIVLLSPFEILLTKVNNGYSKQLTFAFLKREKGNYSFTLETYKDGKEYSYKAFVDSLRIRRGYAELKDDKKETFILPFKAMKEEGVASIKEIAKEIEEYNRLKKK